jgi:hypothetical protein
VAHTATSWRSGASSRNDTDFSFWLEVDSARKRRYRASGMAKAKRKYIHLKFSDGLTIVESKGDASDAEVKAAAAFWTRIITGKWPKELP